jgi:hypothetical protein
MRFILFFAILLYSCDQKKEDNKQQSSQIDTSKNIRERIIDHADTIINKPIGKGFYKNAKGDIFELKRSGAGEDSLGWFRIQFLDSTIKDGDWDKPGQLKKYIDIDTYNEDSISFYSKDKGHVYWERSTSDGPVRFVVWEADPKTFYGLKDYWAKDKNHVFYRGSIVKYADPKTIKIFGQYNDSAMDKKYIYAQGEMIR